LTYAEVIGMIVRPSATKRCYQKLEVRDWHSLLEPMGWTITFDAIWLHHGQGNYLQ